MQITSSIDLGHLVRRVRQAQKLTQAQLAAACGTGLRFIVDLERGKPTCELEKSLKVLAMLGVNLNADHDQAGA